MSVKAVLATTLRVGMGLGRALRVKLGLGTKLSVNIVLGDKVNFQPPSGLIPAKLYESLPGKLLNILRITTRLLRIVGKHVPKKKKNGGPDVIPTARETHVFTVVFERSPNVVKKQ